MFIKRSITSQVKQAAKEFPVIAIVGPRQSGKTTLAQTEFNKHAYVSLEDYDIRELAKSDPRTFLETYPSKKGIILDEIQHAPELLSYMQTIVDREKKNGFFIVTGSQNFMVDQAITQTLAGRMAILTLLPLSIGELKKASVLPKNIDTFLYKGCYPKAYSEKITTSRLYKNYLRAYVERDVRQVKNVADLSVFQKFMQLCAGRIGQILNLSSLGNDCGINHATVKSWLSILEASYVIYLLYPYYKNFGKRVIKAPKIYFYDTGLACSLLKIEKSQDLVQHYLRGGLVESAIIVDLLKQQYNLDRQPSLYFWRDKTGNEIDCIIERAQDQVPIEIKAGKTVAQDYFKGLNYWKETVKESKIKSYLIYGGDKNQKWPQGNVVSWNAVGDLIKKL